MHEARMRSYSTATCSTAGTGECTHIAFAKTQQASLKPLPSLCLSQSVLETFAIPKDVKSKLVKYLNEGIANSLIRLVSKSCFAIQDFTSTSTPFGLVHMRIDKENKSFHCTCSAFKHSTSLASNSTAPKLSKRCAHYYAVMWVVLSNKQLQQLLNFDISKNGNYALAIFIPYAYYYIDGDITSGQACTSTVDIDAMIPSDQVQTQGIPITIIFISCTPYTIIASEFERRKSSVKALVASNGRIPEDPSELQEIMLTIQAMNANQVSI